jgi:hypothetical protein
VEARPLVARALCRCVDEDGDEGDVVHGLTVQAWGEGGEDCEVDVVSVVSQDDLIAYSRDQDDAARRRQEAARMIRDQERAEGGS